MLFIFLSRWKDKRIPVAFWDLWSIYVLYTLAAVILNPLFNICPTGRVLIGKEEVEMDSVGEEVSLWEKMMQYPDSWAEGTLPLRSTMKKGKWGQGRPYPLYPVTGRRRNCKRRDCGFIFLWAAQMGRCLERLGGPQGRCWLVCSWSLQTSDCIHWLARDANCSMSYPTHSGG